jgi:hypothetical protein
MVRSIAQGLGETSIQVHGEGSCNPIDGFLQAVTQSVVRVINGCRCIGKGLQAIGGIVNVRVYTVIEEIALIGEAN